MRLPTSTLLFYAMPAVPLAALTLPLYIIVPTFYTETLGLSLAAVGVVLFAVRVFDAVIDPLVGWASDRWRPRSGRRRTFFILSLPLTGISALMLFWPPQGVGLGWLGFWSVMLSLGYTATLLPYTAWGAELAGNYAERSRVSGFREGLTLVGTLVAIALPFAVGLDTAQGIHGLAMLGIAVVALLALAGPLAVWRVPEPREYSISRNTLRDGLRNMVANRPFLRLIAAFLINGLANGIPATLFLYFVSDRLGAPEMRGPLLFGYFLCGIAGIPLALWAAARIGKHRAWSVAMLFCCAVFAFAPLAGSGDIVGFAAISVLTGLTLGFDLALPPAIQADVIDVDTASSGEQRSGIYFAAWSLATQLALALAAAIAFPLLDLFGFRPGAANDATALFGLAAIYAWLPVVLKIAAVGLMWNFPIDEAEQTRLRADIESRAG